MKDSTDIANIRENFTTFDELSQLTSSNISDLVDDFRRITLTAGKYAMPLTIQKLLKFTIDWLLYFETVNRVPTLVGLDQDSFRSALKEAGKRATIINKQKYQSDTISIEAAPGALKIEKDWTRWSEAFYKQLNTLYGTLGVPLKYVIRELEIPDGTVVYSTFVEEYTFRSPLIGIKYEANTRQLHQLILSSKQGQPSHEWITPLTKKKNERIYRSAPRAHYQGEGNPTRRIAEAECLRDSLHYINERGLPFAFYLSKMQQMFTLNKEPYSDAMKLRFLYDTIKHPQLMTTVSTLQVR